MHLCRPERLGRAWRKLDPSVVEGSAVEDLEIPQEHLIACADIEIGGGVGQ